jgi:hypothetical protein
MTYRVLVVAIFFLSLVSSAFGLSEEIPVTTNGLDQGKYVFSVVTRTTTNGIAFHVVISKKASAIPANSNVGVCIVTHWDGGSGSEISPVKPEIKVTLKRGGHSWTADFVASQELLQTAGASFVFTEYEYPGTAEFYEIKLRDFAPPIRPQH